MHPGDSYEPLRLLTPPLREAMLTRRLPTWAIAGGVLITAYDDVPRIENLGPRADVACHVAYAVG